MNADSHLEQRVVDALNRAASTREPDGLLDSVLSTVGRTRTRPRWLALIKEPPMRIHSRVAVGSPTARLAYLFLLTLMLTIVATGAVVAGASLVPGTVIVVAQDGTGTVPTITEGVALARDGETVLVKPGTYLESIAITEDITLRGDGARGAVVIEFTADGPTRTWVPCCESFAYGILLDGSDARVENLTVRGPAESVAVQVDGGAPVIDGVDIFLDGDSGLQGPYFKRSAFRIQGGSSPVIRDSAWDGYTRIDGGANAPVFEGDVVTTQYLAVGGSGNAPVIRGNTFLSGAGISWTDTGSGGIVEDNDISGSISLDAGGDPTIRGNRIRFAGDGSAAIQISGGSAAVVDGNEITDSAYGITVSGLGADPEIRSNTIRGSSVAAISAQGGAAPTLDGNVIEENATGIEVIGNSIPVMTGNTLCQNGTDLVVPEGSTLTLAGNKVCDDSASAAP